MDELLCDCSLDFLPQIEKCPKTGSNCLIDYNGKSTSFDKTVIERKIQNQSRMPESQYQDAYKAVTVAQDILSFKGDKKDFYNMSSKIWSNPNYLRNQSDRSTPSRSGAYTSPGNRSQAFGDDLKMPGYVNVPTRGNSTTSTITGNRPGAMTPGGQGVDVKHGSYHRYLAKKKGFILSKNRVDIETTPRPLEGENNMYFFRKNPAYKSSTINNMSYKFVPVSLNSNCYDCSNSFFNN